MRMIAIDDMELRRHYQLRVAGVRVQLHTNSSILGISLDRWQTAQEADYAGEFAMRILVAGNRNEDQYRPHFRGLRHLVFATFGSGNAFTFDLLRRTVTAVVSRELAADRLFWNRTLLPIAVGVLGSAVGIVPVHCACLSIEGAGLLIAGTAGAGKSTLSFALAQNGFDFVSDDWTYISESHGQLTAHGMPVPVKLLPDAIGLFPVLASYSVGIALNNEACYELPVEDLATVRHSTVPRWFALLERSATVGCTINSAPGWQVRRYLENSLEALPPQLAALDQFRENTILHMSELSCWKITYGGSPDVAVRALREFVVQQRREASA